RHAAPSTCSDWRWSRSRTTAPRRRASTSRPWSPSSAPASTGSRPSTVPTACSIAFASRGFVDMSGPVTLDDVRRGLRAARYITTPRVETALFLALTLEKPLLAEGPAGAGKSDPEFEAFLLEVLSDFQVSVPELGTIRARHRPAVVLTSNRTRELSEALVRRCLHLYVDFPGPEKEAEIIALKVPELDEKLRAQVARFVAGLRKLELRKAPSIAETLDWARGLCAPGV